MLWRARDLVCSMVSLLSIWATCLLMYFRAIVRVKPHNDKRELGKNQFQHRQQKGLADALHTSLNLPLADLIHTGDVVHPLEAVQVALVDAVNPDEACAPSGPGCLAHADGVAHRAGLGK